MSTDNKYRGSFTPQVPAQAPVSYVGGVVTTSNGHTAKLKSGGGSTVSNIKMSGGGGPVFEPHTPPPETEVLFEPHTPSGTPPPTPPPTPSPTLPPTLPPTPPPKAEEDVKDKSKGGGSKAEERAYSMTITYTKGKVIDSVMSDAKEVVAGTVLKPVNETINDLTLKEYEIGEKDGQRVIKRSAFGSKIYINIDKAQSLEDTKKLVQQLNEEYKTQLNQFEEYDKIKDSKVPADLEKKNKYEKTFQNLQDHNIIMYRTIMYNIEQIISKELKDPEKNKLGMVDFLKPVFRYLDENLDKNYLIKAGFDHKKIIYLLSLYSTKYKSFLITDGIDKTPASNTTMPLSFFPKSLYMPLYYFDKDTTTAKKKLLKELQSKWPMYEMKESKSKPGNFYYENIYNKTSFFVTDPRGAEVLQSQIVSPETVKDSEFTVNEYIGDLLEQHKVKVKK